MNHVYPLGYIRALINTKLREFDLLWVYSEGDPVDYYDSVFEAAQHVLFLALINNDQSRETQIISGLMERVNDEQF